MFNEISKSNIYKKKSLLSLTKDVLNSEFRNKRFLWKHILNHDLILNSISLENFKIQRSKELHEQRAYKFPHETNEGFSRLTTFLGEVD